MDKASTPTIVTGPLVGPSEISSIYPDYDPIIYSVCLANGVVLTRPSGFAALAGQSDLLLGLPRTNHRRNGD